MKDVRAYGLGSNAKKRERAANIAAALAAALQFGLKPSYYNFNEIVRTAAALLQRFIQCELMRTTVHRINHMSLHSDQNLDDIQTTIDAYNAATRENDQKKTEEKTRADS